MTDHPSPATSSPAAVSALDRERERLARIALTQVIEPAQPGWSEALSKHHNATGLYRAILNGTTNQTLGGSMSGPMSAPTGESAGESFSDARLAERLAGVDPEEILNAAVEQGYRYVIPGDLEWPSQLDRLAGQPPVHRVTGAPVGLWVRGLLSLYQMQQSYSITGSRDASSYGIDLSARLACELGEAGLIVAAGGSVGIDAAAHGGVLAGSGRTVAVLPTGVDRFWPAQNLRLLEAVARNGAVISEYAPGTVATRPRSLARHRLVAALTLGTVVVEASSRSGALVTALWAERLGKPVMAVPGPVGSTTSTGTHRLIQDGRARLVTNADDICEVIEPRPRR